MHVVRWALGACAMFGACQQCRFATMDFATGTAWPALWTHLTYCDIHRHNAMVGISVEPLTVIEGLTPAAQVGVRVIGDHKPGFGAQWLMTNGMTYLS